MQGTSEEGMNKILEQLEDYHMCIVIIKVI